MKQTKSGKSEIILNTLSPYDSKVQRYLSLSKEIEQLIKKRIAEFEAEHGIIDEAALASN